MTDSIQLIGAAGFGALIGWYVYFINRYRSGDVQLGDLVTVIGVLGGAGVLALFPAQSSLFGAYGVGLAIGFFGYFLILVVLVWKSPNFDVDWFLDGRRADPGPGIGYGTGPNRAMIAPKDPEHPDGPPGV